MYDHLPSPRSAEHPWLRALRALGHRTAWRLRFWYEWLGDNEPEILGFLGLLIVLGLIAGTMIFFVLFWQQWQLWH